VLEFSNRPDSRRRSSRPQAQPSAPFPAQGESQPQGQPEASQRPRAKRSSAQRSSTPKSPPPRTETAKKRRSSRTATATPIASKSSQEVGIPSEVGNLPVRPQRKRFFLLELLSRISLPRSRATPVKPPARSRPDAKRRGRQPTAAKSYRPTTPLVHATRLLIVGVGVGSIAGTSLSVWNPAVRSPSATAAIAQSAPPQIMAANALSGGQNMGNIAKNTLGSGQEIPGLIAKIAPLTQGLTDLTPGVFMVDLDKGNYYSFNGDMSFSAASTIKVPVLIAFFQDVDAGKIRLDETLTMEPTDIVDNSGDMQYSPPGTQYSALEVATKMIVISDNTGTNMLIRRLGGIEKLNQRFKQWGLQQTVLRNMLPDLTGTNTTSPKELTTLLTAVSQGQLISMASRDRAMFIMSQTETDTLLPATLGAGAKISHKTGDIKSMVGDTGIIDMPSGKRYVITTLMKRPDNDSRAQDLIRQIASTIYQYLDPIKPAAEPADPSAPEGPQTEPAAIDAPPANGAEPAPADAPANALPTP
jgi:beta-lactamase class A